MQALRLMCTPGALPDDATVTITAFADAFCAASAPEETSAPPSGVPPVSSAGLQVAPAAPVDATQCAVAAATAQHCLALAALALPLLTRCLRLRPAACSEMVPLAVICETWELMEYGDIELQVRHLTGMQCSTAHVLR